MGCLLSHMLYFTEKFTLWMSALLLVSCLVITLLTMLLVGIGLGYNYCYVDHKNKTKPKSLIAVDQLSQLRTDGYLKNYENKQHTLPTPQRKGKPKTETVEKYDRYAGGYVPGPSRYKYSGYPWNREESNAVTATIGTKVVDSGFITVKHKTPIPLTKNEHENLEQPYTTEYNPPFIPTRTIVINYTEGYKEYNEVDPRTAGFVQIDEYEKKLEKKMVTSIAFDTGYTQTPVKYIKLKNKENKIGENPDIKESEKAEDKVAKYTKKGLSISGLDLMKLLSQLGAENRNYSLQILV